MRKTPAYDYCGKVPRDALKFPSPHPASVIPHPAASNCAGKGPQGCLLRHGEAKSRIVHSGDISGAGHDYSRHPCFCFRCDGNLGDRRTGALPLDRSETGTSVPFISRHLALPMGRGRGDGGHLSSTRRLLVRCLTDMCQLSDVIHAVHIYLRGVSDWHHLEYFASHLKCSSYTSRLLACYCTDPVPCVPYLNGGHLRRRGLHPFSFPDK